VTLAAALTAGSTVAVAATGEYQNTAFLSIAAKNPSCACNPDTTASLYPASINVAGLAGAVTKATVTLNGITHEDLFDLAVLLVGPAGQNVVLMSAFPAGKVTNQTPTFDDAGSVLSPSSCSSTYFVMPARLHPFPCSEGSPAGTFPSPAPAEPYGSALAVFNGTNPNGTWRLYAANNAPGGSGSIASGWTLDIETQTPPTSSPPPEAPAPTTPTPAPTPTLAAPTTSQTPSQPTPSIKPASKKPTTAQLLARAVKKCGKVRAKRRRAECIAAARRRYAHKTAKKTALTITTRAATQSAA
jgi:subtilisin-like proprotein convertase family protein